VGGWIETLHASALGAHVTKGEPLFTLYSPELYSAQAELLQALRSQEAARGTAGSGRSDALVRAARTRLRLWDVPEPEIAALVRRGAPAETIAFRAPASGTIVEKAVVQGAAVEPGVRLLRIAPLGRVWIEADIAESEQGILRVGQRAAVRLPSAPGVTRDATVAWVSPTLDPATRSVRVRLVLANEDGALRPDAFAEVELRVPLGERLLVPASAVLYAGPRRVVFVDLGDGRLRPTEVVLGPGDGESFEAVSGLEEGQQVVVSGNFLVAAESRLKSALEGW
jgi:Cu(I)/Ag(I) efflux system membrane fusion protein